MAIAMVIRASAKMATHWTEARNSVCHVVIHHVAKVIAQDQIYAHATRAMKQTHTVCVFRNVRMAVIGVNALRLVNALVMPDSNYSITDVLHCVIVAV